MRSFNLALVTLLILGSCSHDKFIEGDLNVPDYSFAELKGPENKILYRSTSIKRQRLSIYARTLPQGVYVLHITSPNKFVVASIPLYLEKGRYYQVSSNITDTAAIINAKPKSKKILKLNIETNSILTKQLLSLEHGRIIIFKRYEAKRDSILLLSDQLLSKNDIETYKSQLNNYHNLYKNYYLRECEKIEHQFIQQNKGSAIAAYLISSAPDLSQNRIFYNLIINQLDPALKLNRYSIDAKSKLAKLSEVNIGDYFPPLAGDEISGNRLSAKFGYKLTVIQFWASFDLKSRAANKAWSSLVNAKSINKKGIEIISVSFDTSREVWKNAIIKDNLQWQQLSELLPMDECENTARFNILHLPVNYLVDGELKVIAKNVTANYVMKKCSSMN